MNFLPTTAKELQALGWEQADIILFTGDAYIDHPSFGAAVIGRTLEAAGYRVAIVPQPNWRDDLRDFRKLGKPRLFFGVTSGSMDSMVNHYTANRRLRSNDAYTPEGKAGFRPDYACSVYTKILKELYPDTPVILGGIEASLRRFCHYDYWEDRIKPSILVDSQADLLVYGMGEKTILQLAECLKEGENWMQVPQIAFLQSKADALAASGSDAIQLYSYEECLKDKRKYGANFKQIEIESNKMQASLLLEACGDKVVRVNPPQEFTSKDLDASFDLPYARLPHPRYKGKHIPAFEMIKFSVNIHRGCFGGCSFCTISAHQGKFVISRSKDSILREIRNIVSMEDFKGNLSDLGGPSANMYGMHGKDLNLCRACLRPSCLFPKPCRNLNENIPMMLNLYEEVRNLPGIRKVTIGSGLRYDQFLDESGFKTKDARTYFQTLMKHHVSGRLKVAPEHTEEKVLRSMRKPSYALFEKLKEEFDRYNRQSELREQLIPYFISCHPVCTEEDMQKLGQKTARQGFHLEQVQEFTPTPMTLSTCMYYTGENPYTGEKVFVARDKQSRQKQHVHFFGKPSDQRGPAQKKSYEPRYPARSPIKKQR